MTQFYVNKFNADNPCTHCKTSKKRVGSKTYSLCEDHLEKARNRWSNWSTERRADGKCCYCDEKNFKGFLRCKKHTLYNRKKCKQWHIKNKDRVDNYTKDRKQRYIQAGLCYFCKEHNILEPGFVKCKPCRIYHNENY